MNYYRAVHSGFRNYGNFQGRAARSEYWWWTLFAILVALLAGVLDASLLPNAEYGPFGVLTTLILLLPGLAVSVRRLHDLDWRGWWLLIVITGVGSLVLLIAFCFRGTDGPNRFGPDPLATS